MSTFNKISVKVEEIITLFIISEDNLKKIGKKLIKFEDIIVKKVE